MRYYSSDKGRWIELERIISINNLTFSYNKQSTVLSGITAKILKGDLITLLGPNGVGKSTLLNCITGLLPVSNNIIRLIGRDIVSLKTKHIAQIVAYVPQTVHNNFDYTVIDYITMGRTAYKNMFEFPDDEDYSIAEDALEKLNILYLKNKIVSRISGGEQQQVCIARAIAQQPKLIVLDEPTSALDYDNQIKVLNLTKKLSNFGYSVLMTTHNPEHSLLLDSTVWVLDRDGKMSVGSAEELISEKLLRNLYTSQICVSNISSKTRKVCYVSEL